MSQSLTWMMSDEYASPTTPGPPLSDASDTEPLVVYPAADTAGGALVTCPPDAEVVVVRGAALRVVDLQGNPALRRLSVSECAPGIRLTVYDAPALTHVEVPSEADGAVLILDFGAAMPRLEVTGRVHSVNAAWLEPAPADGHRPAPASFDVKRSGRWDDARLDGLTLQTAPFAPSESDLVVAVCADDEERAAAMALHGGRAKRVFVVDRSGRARLRIWHGGRDLSGPARAAVLGVLTSPAAAESPSLPAIAEQPAALPTVLGVLASRDVARPRGQSAAERLALRMHLLLWLLEKGHDATRIWAARADLRPSVLRMWAWGVRDRRVWHADLRVWAACRETVQEATEYGAQFARGGDPAQLGGLALFAAEEPALGMPFLLGALRFGAERMSPLGDVRVVELAILLNGLVRLRDHPDCPGVVGLLCEWAQRRLPPEQRVHLLGALRRLGSSAALRALAHAGYSGRSIDPALRHTAVRYMVLPPRWSRPPGRSSGYPRPGCTSRPAPCRGRPAAGRG